MGRHFGTKEGDKYRTINGLVDFDELPDWNGVEGIKYQYIGHNVDPRIWFEGRDYSVFEVEEEIDEQLGAEMHHLVKENADIIKVLLQKKGE